MQQARRNVAGVVLCLAPAAALAQTPWSISPNVVVSGKPTTVTLQSSTNVDVERLYLEPGDWPKPVGPILGNSAGSAVTAVAPESNGSTHHPADEPTLALNTAKALSQDCRVTDAAIANALLFIGCGKQGLRIYDVSAIDRPQWRGSHSQLGNVRWVRAAADDQLVVVDDQHRALVIDVSEPTQPLVNYSFRLAFEPTQLRITGNDLAISDSAQTAHYRLGAAPPRFSNENLNGGEGVNFGGQRRGTIVGHTLYVADWFSGIHLYDITQPQQPRLLSSYHTPGSPKGIVVRDDIAYVADDDQGLHLVDVSNPQRPAHITTIATNGLAYTPIIHNETLYLASHRGGFQIFDISTPRAPRLLSDTGTPGKAWSLAVAGDIVYIADSEGGVLVYDVSDRAQPKHIGAFAPGANAEEIVVDGERAYVAFFDDGVYVLDIRLPQEPRVLAHIDTPGNSRGLHKDGDALWIADWLAGVHRYNVHDPAHPRWQASFDTPGAAWGVRAEANIVYVFDWWGGLRVLQTNGRGELTALASYNQDAPYAAFAGAGRYLYAAQRERGIQVFDIKNPLNPTWITGIELPGTAVDVAIYERLAYVALGKAGLAELDIANPFHPQLRQHVTLDAAAMRVSARANHLAVADEHNNVHVYAVPGDDDALRKPIAQFAHASDIAMTDTALFVLDDHGLLLRALLAQPNNAEPWFTTAPLRFVRATNDTVLALTQNGNVLLLDPTHPDTTLSSPALDEPVTGITLDGGMAYAITTSGIVAIDVGRPRAPQIAARYPLSRTPAAVTPYASALYGSGGSDLLAILPLPSLVRVDATSPAQFIVPARLPEGVYNVRGTTTAGVPVLLENALRVRGFKR